MSPIWPARANAAPNAAQRSPCPKENFLRPVSSVTLLRLVETLFNRRQSGGYVLHRVRRLAEHGLNTGKILIGKVCPSEKGRDRFLQFLDSLGQGWGGHF